MNPAQLEARRFDRDGLALAAHVARVASEGARPVLLQHGLCGSAQQTAEAFPDDARWRLHTLECRGHGASPPGPLADLSIATYADDVSALIDAWQLGPVILGGISMGAAIALRLAVQRPAQVRALVLVRPAWLFEAAPPHLQPNIEVGTLLKQGDPTRARAAFEESATARRLAQASPDNLASLRGFFAREPQALTAELLTRLSADGPGVSEAELHALDLPALVVGCADDELHPLALAWRLAGTLRHGRFVQITSKSHSREAYLRELHAALAAFLEKVPA